MSKRICKTRFKRFNPILINKLLQITDCRINLFKRRGQQSGMASRKESNKTWKCCWDQLRHQVWRWYWTKSSWNQSNRMKIFCSRKRCPRPTSICASSSLGQEIRPPPNPDESCDIWSFGCLLVEVVTGEEMSSSLMVRATDWELGDLGSIPGLGKIFDPLICLNYSFLVDDYLSQDWLLCRNLIRIISYTHLSNWKSSDYIRHNFQSKRTVVKSTLLSLTWFNVRIISS